ncbi:MAG: hypothetical protein EA350_15965 [Gemmatimonadales bacterium]|nr:MAG: hypothetical protein EA350_15965 [Gemmatimonadales bacterium]
MQQNGGLEHPFYLHQEPDMSARPSERDSERSFADDLSTDDRSSSERSVDDLDAEDLASDDIALSADEATRGPFRPTPPRPGEDEGFMEGPDGEAVDPVYREATPEIDVYEDLPSRRARAEPDEATDDGAPTQDPEADHRT